MSTHVTTSVGGMRPGPQDEVGTVGREEEKESHRAQSRRSGRGTSGSEFGGLDGCR